ncbi:threonine/serine dehydratase [Nitratireductor aquimarinus]|uniref:threonine ammonia-lyase n=1 Tax=Nitratireductor TaxID=245876 RepID=UPI0019D337FD|nr:MULTISPECIES: threonine/serine dehydratase [Nitratireductor]MBN7778846.1 threonine/serine dehydratase [Nitratireductor pacificus]MBN7783169.1 threonine/serine dehydratase [Nitratireductor pacificus]MBN7791958.1 threonine/serine dehydratase [Nitratireductor aquimarinus]MBY6101234.1 threonine/serine dehydratase [Nitratireductor aquimarinus]MCA1261685.1 threonine/serine dehydratase [Nitratireductor aquimarinus]
MIDIEDIRAASARISPYVRRTPLLPATQLSKSISCGELYLKLECLQPSGSFKARGAANKLFSASPKDVRHGLVAASGGNHGLAVARSANLAGVPAHIFLPDNVLPDKIEKMKRWGATAVIAGKNYDEANSEALEHAQRTGALYFHSFADPTIVAGQGTVGLEVLEDLPDVDTIVVAIGGGGFITGAAVALKSARPEIRVIGVEPVGSPTLHKSMETGSVAELERVTTLVPTMACRRTDDALFALARTVIDEIVLVEDEAMADAAKKLWFEFGVAADLSGAAAVAALSEGLVSVKPGEKICAPVCGAGLPS